jgi:cytochrome c oxidase subunit 3
MVKDIQLTEEPRKTFTMDPKKFILWLFIVSIIMLFGAFTSAYMVKKASGDWLSIALPGIFYFNTVVILLSSASMHIAVMSTKKNNLKLTRIALVITSILGLTFLAGQYSGWQDLVRNNVFFVGHPSGSFIYVLTGVHGIHLVSGVIFLFIIVAAAFRFKVHSKSQRWIQMCATYWHFLDALWLYLFIFLLLNN